MRASRIEMLMSIAETIALRSTCDRLNVGAIITRDSRVVSTGYNGNVAGALHCRHIDGSPCTSAVHAEANAIVFSARHGVGTEGAELFTTHQPCEGCAKLIVNSGLTRVFFKHEYRLREGLDLLIKSSVEVYRVHEDYSTHQVVR